VIFEISITIRLLFIVDRHTALLGDLLLSVFDSGCLSVCLSVCPQEQKKYFFVRNHLLIELGDFGGVMIDH